MNAASPLRGFAGLAFALLGAVAHAQIIPLSYTVSGQVSGQHVQGSTVTSFADQKSLSGLDGPLGIDARGSVTVSQPPFQGLPPTVTVRANATANVSLTSTGLSVDTQAFAGYGGISGVASANASASDSLTFTFRVDVPTPYTLLVTASSHEAFTPSNTGAVLPTVTGLGVVLVPIQNDLHDKSSSFSGGGILMPGIYSISTLSSVGPMLIDPIGNNKEQHVTINLAAAVRVPDSGYSFLLLLLSFVGVLLAQFFVRAGCRPRLWARLVP